jgi:hypothetical protein
MGAEEYRDNNMTYRIMQVGREQHPTTQMYTPGILEQIAIKMVDKVR